MLTADANAIRDRVLGVYRRAISYAIVACLLPATSNPSKSKVMKVQATAKGYRYLSSRPTWQSASSLETLQWRVADLTFQDIVSAFSPVFGALITGKTQHAANRKPYLVGYCVSMCLYQHLEH